MTLEKKEETPIEESIEIIFHNNLQALRFAVTRKYGSANVYASGEALYWLIFDHGNVEALITELNITYDEKFPKKLDRLRKNLLVPNGVKLPSKEDFIKMVLKAFTDGEDVRASLYPQAREALETIMLQGPVRIWTAGDMEGVTWEELTIPGSKEQLTKVGKSRISTVRNKVAKVLQSDSRVTDLEKGGKIDRTKYRQDRTHLFSIRAAENKINLLPEIAREFSEMGVEKLAIIEDRLENLEKARAKLKETGLPEESLNLVWVRQGIYKDSIPKYLNGQVPSDIHSVSNLSELKQYVTTVTERNEKPGFVVDFDGVLSDDEKRQELQNGAVYAACQERGWVL